MLFTRMRFASARRTAPRGEPRVACAGILDGAVQPRIEGCGRFGAASGEHRGHVVVAHPASDDEYAALTQWRQCFADPQMQTRIETPLQRQLKYRDIRVRVDQQKWDEDTVVQPALAVHRRVEPAVR